MTLLPGDGIGSEITKATAAVLEKLAELTEGLSFEFEPALTGGAALDTGGDPFPKATLASCQRSDAVLLACIGGPAWDHNPHDYLRPETGLLAMRKGLGLIANLRPAKVLPQLVDASTLKREVVEGVSLVTRIASRIYTSSR